MVYVCMEYVCGMQCVGWYVYVCYMCILWCLDVVLVCVCVVYVYDICGVCVTCV